MERKHGTPPKVIVHSLEEVDQQIEERLRTGKNLALTHYCRKIWATGFLITAVGNDVWEVEGYTKATLTDLIVRGELESYRYLPPPVKEFLDSTFE